MYMEPEGAAAAAGEQNGSPQQQAAPEAKGGSSSEQQAAPHPNPGSSAGQEAERDDLSKLTVAQLKDRLRERGLPVSGVKVCERVCVYDLRLQKGALQDERLTLDLMLICLPVLGDVRGCTTGGCLAHRSEGAQACAGSVCDKGSLWRSSRGY